MNVFDVTVQIGFTREILVTNGAGKLLLEVNTLLMHLHVAFLVGLVVTPLKVAGKLEGSRGLFFAFTGREKLDVVSPKLSVVVKSFATLLTTVLLRLIMHNLYVLSQVGERFMAVGTGFQLLVWVLKIMNIISVLIQDRSFVEYFVAEVARI